MLKGVGQVIIECRTILFILYILLKFPYAIDRPRFRLIRSASDTFELGILARDHRRLDTA